MKTTTQNGFGLTGILIAILVVLIIGTGGIYVAKNISNDKTAVSSILEEENKTNDIIQRTNTASEQNNDSNRISINEIEIGDKIGNFIVKSFENYNIGSGFTINFTGQTTVSGQYYINEMLSSTCFNVSEESYKEIPRLKEDNRNPWFCFLNEKFAKEELPINIGDISKTIEITIKNYIVNASPKEASDMAELVDNKTSDWKTYRNEELGFEIQYLEDTLTLVQSTISPPYLNFTSSHNTSKLISADRVDKLGKEECYYGLSGKISVCTTKSESGIEFILINDSLQNLTAPLEDALKSNVSIVGKQSVKYNIGAEGDGVDFYFVPISENKTFVILREYTGEMPGASYTFPTQDLFDRVISTLKFID